MAVGDVADAKMAKLLEMIPKGLGGGCQCGGHTSPITTGHHQEVWLCHLVMRWAVAVVAFCIWHLDEKSFDSCESLSDTAIVWGRNSNKK